MAKNDGAARPTIKDVAEQAGVSMATVSNVVNGHAHVRDVTKHKVLEAIKDLGYQASRAAKSLPAGRTHLLAYCLPGDTEPNPALDVFLHHLVARATDEDLEFLMLADRGPDRIAPYAEVLRRGGADGFVLSGIDYADRRVEFLQQRNVPFACFGRVVDPSVTWVDVDGAAGVAAAVDHVTALGRERLCFVGWPQGSATGDDRCGGFEGAVDRMGMAPQPIVRSLNDFDLGRKLADEVMHAHAPDAIVCVSDTLALGVMAGLRDLGVSIGVDVAVTGFDNVPAASLTAPGLTSVRQPMERVGALLVERLVAQLSGEDAPESVLVEPDLIVRTSTQGLAG